MTERKPTGVSFESWIDKQVREAEMRGEFKDLPGAGKPLPDQGKPPANPVSRAGFSVARPTRRP